MEKLIMTPNEIAVMALRKAGKFHDVAYVQLVEEAINNLLEDTKGKIISDNKRQANVRNNDKMDKLASMLEKFIKNVESTIDKIEKKRQ